MDIFHFFKIARRSWPLVLGLPLAVLVLALATLSLPAPRYSTTAKIAVTQTGIAPAESSFPDFNSYHSWAASEYVATDLPEVVNSARFVEDLVAWVRQERGIALDAPGVQAGLAADRVHRVLNLTVSAPTPEGATALAEGAAALLRDKGLAYWNRAERGGLDVALLEVPPPAAGSRLRGPLITLAMRVTLGLALGLILAFARHALDATIRDRDDLEALGLPLVGAIPPQGRGARGERRAALRMRKP